MGYEAPELHGWLGEEVAEAKQRGTLTDAEAVKLTAVYDAELVGYTYLEEM